MAEHAIALYRRKRSEGRFRVFQRFPRMIKPVKPAGAGFPRPPIVVEEIVQEGTASQFIQPRSHAEEAGRLVGVVRDRDRVIGDRRVVVGDPPDLFVIGR